jgi:membrane-associated phospholipid phosphatase
MMKFLVTLSFLGASLSAQVTGSTGPFTDQANPPASQAADPSLNPVVQWNRELLVIVRTSGAQSPTIHPTRSFAIMHAAIYDAVNNIDRTHRPYLVQFAGVSHRASEAAAVDAAAHAVLVALYPDFQTALDSKLDQLLAIIPDGVHKTQGIRVGEMVADAVLDDRTDDGSSDEPPAFKFESAPGDYQSTPPNFPEPQFTEWSRVIPFALETASQFRPGPPPELTSETYSAVFNEVKSLGIANSTAATADQALTGRFWNGAIQNYWNEITQTAVLAHKLSLPESARLFALLNLTFADDVIAFYDAKYTYKLWRPVTAIRAAGTDKNPDTAADANWLPEVGKTTPDPSYPGAHAVISASGALVLRSFFKHNHFNFTVTSEVLPGVERSFTSFSAAQKEATLSRIFAGVHFRSDLTTGTDLGEDVARFVLDHFLLPRDSGDRSDVDR